MKKVNEGKLTKIQLLEQELRGLNYEIYLLKKSIFLIYEDLVEYYKDIPIKIL